MYFWEVDYKGEVDGSFKSYPLFSFNALLISNKDSP